VRDVDVDRIEFCGGDKRPPLDRLQIVVIHKIGAMKLAAHLRRHGVVIGSDGDAFATIEEFFLRDAEGVSTTTVGGSYNSKSAIRSRWYEEGIPPSHRARAHVPYHRVVDADGRVTAFLPLDRNAAHSGMRLVNATSVAVACVGDFEDVPPTAPQILALKYLVRDILAEHPGVHSVVGHDSVIANPKGCPGRLMRVAEVRRWAEDAAAQIIAGKSRR